MKIGSPFGKLNYIGDMLSIAYPTTIVYENDRGLPVIVEWLDENDKGDLHLIYESNISRLTEFINGLISHLELIKSAERRQYYIFHGDIENAQFERRKYKHIDQKSLPKPVSYFKPELSSDYESISRFFNVKISDQQENAEYFNVLKNHSKEQHSGLLRLHLNEGDKVGHGNVDTRALGRILMGFENLYHEVALDVIRGSDRNFKVNNLPEGISISDMSSTEAVIQEAASFSIYLRPKTDTESNSEKYEYIGDEIFTNVTDVISLASSKKNLESIKQEYSSDVFGSLIAFSNVIIENKVVLDMDYFNFRSNAKSRQVIKPSEAHTIHNNVSTSVIERHDKLDSEGKFTMLNTKTGYFYFRSKEGREFSGYVSHLLREGMKMFNFQDTYAVVISQYSYQRIYSKYVSVRQVLESCTKT